MSDIKTKDRKPKSIKTINRAGELTKKIKDPVSYLNSKVDETSNSNSNISDYGSDKIKSYSDKTKDVALYTTNKVNNYIRQKVKSHIKKNHINSKTIKNANKTIKTSEKVVKETAKVSKRIVEQGRKLAIEGAKKTIQGIKVITKVTVSAIKTIIAGMKSLIGMLAAGGTAAIIAIIIICFIGLIATSIYGIFLSSEKTSKDGITMKDVVAECNQEFSDKLELTQNQTPHEAYVLEGNMASWKDILTIYAIKQSNGVNEQEVITIDDNKKAIIKKIFWDMNEITYEVKTENVENSRTNTLEPPTIEEKEVLHIYINSKTADDMKVLYNFNQAQLLQYNELSNSKFANLWNGVIYGSIDSGKYATWRQRDPKWANIRMGNSSGTIGSIGCLVTSIAILIEKSGVNNKINPFNPGTFVEALNKNGGFDSNGNLQYGAITKVVPRFKYVDKVYLNNKSRDEKLALIKQYLDSGYYITAEVLGDTPGSQHWVAVTKVESNSIFMIDPSSEQTNMWNAYNYVNTSQFNYFMAS